MTESEHPVVALPEIERVELEKLCRHLIKAYLRMFEKPEADHLLKGLSMSRESSNPVSISPEGSSVDPPSRHAEVSTLLQEVHQTIPSPQNNPLPSQLPASLQQLHPVQVKLQDVEGAFPLDQAEHLIEKKAIHPVEMMMIYLRCFRNCLECDPQSILQIVHDEVAQCTMQGRMIGFFSIILADVMEICYPDQRLEAIIAKLISDLREYRNQEPATS